jgi:hypothetical protein
VLDIAAGAGKLKLADKRRYFSMARGSVMECDLLNALGHLSPDEYRAGELLITRIGAMLSKIALRACDHSSLGTFTWVQARACSPILPTRFH